ncbi:hypothetical protein [Tautonia plasticadhaerens]|uniref:Uncharacterized protein n=1 Tax=Tautonia plasticadhaerens TaxID=2527974 RepID=A0A518H5B1_9BACT|nr:hypothetical protein [Tautonia plasticadhaerens]QDV36020.1 hypothetical protein ElP_39300 [Tautonia plasticadhaerens]
MFTNEHDRQAVRRDDPAHESPLPRLQEFGVEAPDRGDDPAEPPEDAVSRSAEAPDAGDARAGLLDQEYTHGRSMS